VLFVLFGVGCKGIMPVHIQIELGQSDLNLVFPLDEVNTEFFEMLETNVVPTNCDEPLGIDDIRIDLLLPGLVVEVSAWHRKARVYALDTELQHGDSRSVIRVREGVAENQIQHQLACHRREWAPPEMCSSACSIFCGSNSL
jgi:hypothetical protein